MKSVMKGVVCLSLLGGMWAPAFATDACSTRAVLAFADVTVSDGSMFKTKSYYHTKDSVAHEQIVENGSSLLSVEGPFVWTKSGEEADYAAQSYKSFILGHQFHAFYLYFDEIVGAKDTAKSIQFNGHEHMAVRGRYPYGGYISLVQDKTQSRPIGLRFEFSDTPAIDIVYSKWQHKNGMSLPHHLQINDGTRVFEYEYTNIVIEDKTPLWFSQTIDAPELDKIKLYRLHRKLLAAHCLEDAKIMSEQTLKETLVVSRGELNRVTPEDIFTRFSNTFKVLDYTEYHDIRPPVVEISDGGDMGWIAVNTRAVGSKEFSV